MLLKAVAGGGGKGMRLVRSADELERAYATARVEAEAAFSDGSLYLEKALVPARHVEVQVLCDRDGGVLTLGERECSIQRRHQKLVEESPSPALDAATRDEMEAATERACRTIGYENAGTFEFLLGADGTFHFMELNARLQVEHPVSELVTGIDLVREQLRVAAGERLRRDGPRAAPRARDRDPAQRGGSRPRLRARARDDRALPAAARARRPHRHAPRGGLGDLALLRLADREARRLGGGSAGGDRARCARAGGDGADGIPTTRELALDILRSPEFAEGDYSTSFLEEMEGRLPALAAG